LACSNDVLSSAVVVDSRSHHSAPTCFARGIDCGKWIKGIKRQVICGKHGPVLELELTPANLDDRASAGPMLSRLSDLQFQGDLLGDTGYKGEPFAAAARVHDGHGSASPGGTGDERLMPKRIHWVIAGTTPCSTATPIC
jgi:hypothetical protein